MGKGGVGKSLISWLQAQYFKSQERDLYCADTDPTNASFHKFSALNVEYIQILNQDMSIAPANFDMLIERLMEHEGESVIDSGASSFLPLMHYLNDNNVFEILENSGHEIVIHVPLVGGVAMEETMRGLELILKTFNVKVVLWENEYFGPIEINGIRLSDAALVRRYPGRVIGAVQMKAREMGTYGIDIRETMAKALTMEEAIASSATRLMRKQRLLMFQRDIFNQLLGLGL
jgi:hypothetical protein